MKGLLFRFALPVTILSGLIPTAFADVATVYSSKDTSIFAPSADMSSGGGNLYSGRLNLNGNGELRRALLAFDIAAALPSGATINSVSLTLNVIQSLDSSSRTFTLHRLTSNWGNPTGANLSVATTGQGAPAVPGDATWTFSSYNTTSWATAGGDFVATASGSALSPIGAGPFSFASTVSLVSDVQSWLDNPAGNFGWLLKGDENTLRSVRAIDSKETGGTATGPRLEINFTPGALPGDANLNGVIDLDDFGLIDRGFAQSLTGFSNGDFNRDGVINSADYIIIDTAYRDQGNFLSPQMIDARVAAFGEGYLAQISIPEPASLATCALAALTFLPRRRGR